MLYLIVFWLVLGLVIGTVGATLFWFAVIAFLAKEKRLFIKDEKGNWSPKKPVV